MQTRHGGFRNGAGRKPKYDEPTKTIRIPVSKEREIKALLATPQVKNEVSAIYVVDPQTRRQIPVAMSKVAAGFPINMSDHIEKVIDLNDLLIRNSISTFIVEVESLSLLNAGIDLTDKLIIDRSLDARHNDIVLALIDNDFTLKRLQKKGKEIWLSADNPDFQDIHFKDGQTVSIWGVLTFCIKQFR